MLVVRINLLSVAHRVQVLAWCLHEVHVHALRQLDHGRSLRNMLSGWDVSRLRYQIVGAILAIVVVQRLLLNLAVGT